MSRLIEFLNKKSSGKIILGLFILTNIIYVIMLTLTIPKTMAFANGMKILDMMPMGYDVDYVSDLFTTLGDTGRKVYLTNQLPLDMIYPLLFGLTYCLVIGYFLKKLNKIDTSLIYLCLLPLIAGIADYLENSGIIALLLNYPDLKKEIVNMTSFFSLTKSISTTVFFIVLIILMIISGVSFLKRRSSNVNNS